MKCMWFFSLSRWSIIRCWCRYNLRSILIFLRVEALKGIVWLVYFLSDVILHLLVFFGLCCTFFNLLHHSFVHLWYSQRTYFRPLLNLITTIKRLTLSHGHYETNVSLFCLVTLKISHKMQLSPIFTPFFFLLLYKICNILIYHLYFP